MTDYAGPVQRVVLSRTLWLLVVWPLAGFVWQVVVARRRIAAGRGEQATKRAEASARNAGVGCVALATASVAAHAIVLARLQAPSPALFEPVAPCVILGQLDAGVAFLFDPLSAAFCTLACAVALAASAFVARAPRVAGWRSWAWIQLSLVGALLSFVADGFVGTAAGWAIAGAAAAWLAGWNDAGTGMVTALRTAAALTAMLVGAALLFWGLGGAWDGDDYWPSTQPRIASVRAGDSGWAGDPDAENSAALTFTSLPGAAVFVDDARTPSMRSPFVDAPLQAGAHTLRIHPGDGSYDEVLGTLVLEAGQRLALVLTAPTLAFRAMGDQVILHDRDGNSPARNALSERTGPGAVPVGVAALAALLAAAGVMGGTAPPRGAPRPLAALAQGATTAALGPYLIARVAWLFPLAPGAWIGVQALGAVLLLGAGWRAPTFKGIDRWLALVGIAPTALAYLALGFTSVAASTCIFVLLGAGTAALYLVAARVPETMSRPPVAASAPGLGASLLVDAPARLGLLLTSMDRWVVTALAATLATLMSAAAWTLSMMDEHVVARPAHLLALRMVHVGHGVEPTIGVTLGRVTWTLLALVAFVALAHALWPGR